MNNLPRRLIYIVFALIEVISAPPATKADLAADETFRAPFFTQDLTPSRCLLLPDGKYFLYFNVDTLTDQRTGALTRYLPDGTLDTSFNFTTAYKNVGAVTATDDGKYYVAAGQFFYGSKRSEQVLRLNQDGSIDPGFTPVDIFAWDAALYVREICVQPDGKILIGGLFGGTSSPPGRDGIVRVLSDGTIDSSFAAIALDGYVYTFTLQSDGKILIGGDFTSVNGVSKIQVARLNADGSLDSTFQATGYSRRTSYPTRRMVVQSDGKVVCAGGFQFGTGGLTKRPPLVRFKTDGTLDSTFTSAVGSFPNPRDVALLPDGRFVALIDPSIYRFNSDGSNDSSFHNPTLVNTKLYPSTTQPGVASSLNLQPDGRILIGGSFTDIDASGSSHYGVARLNTDGALQTSFSTSRLTGLEKAPTSFWRLADRTTLVCIARQNNTIYPSMAYNLERLLSDGSLDAAFSLESSNPNSFLLGGFIANGFEQFTDGKLFVFGTKTDFTYSYGKVSTTGVEDTNFSYDSSAPPFQAATTLSDGKVLLSPSSDAQATVYSVLARLQANGQVDNTFHVPTSITNTQVPRSGGSVFYLSTGNRVLAVQPDGKLIFEYADTPNGNYYLVRLNSDGSQDGTFARSTLAAIVTGSTSQAIYDPVQGTTIFPTIYSSDLALLDAKVLANGRILVAGGFTSFNNTAARGIIRLMPDGTIDNSFSTGGGAQWIQTTEYEFFAIPKVEALALQDDGKLLIAGNFEAFNGTAVPGIARLNADGSVDASFVPPVARDRSVNGNASLKRQADGTFLLSGPYKFPGEIIPSSLIRIKELYADDGIDDNWQIQYFGSNNPTAQPNADPDGDGENNLFEFTAGLDPTDAHSRFSVSAGSFNSMGAGSVDISFGPVLSARTYVVQFKTDLNSPTWQTLAGTTQFDSGSIRTVTDHVANSVRKVYRVQVSKN